MISHSHCGRASQSDVIEGARMKGDTNLHRAALLPSTSAYMLPSIIMSVDMLASHTRFLVRAPIIITIL